MDYSLICKNAFILTVTIAFYTLAEAATSVLAPAAQTFKIQKVERTADDGGISSTLLRGKALISFAKPVTGQTVPGEKEKDSKKSFPPAFEFNWVGEPELVDLEKPQKPLQKYSRMHKHEGDSATMNAGETLKTEKGTRVDLMGSDETELSLGQNSILEFTKLEGSGKSRVIGLKLLQGYLKVTIKTALERIGQFELFTPNSYFTPRGSRGLGTSKQYAFHIAVATDSSNVTTTSFLNLEGQTSVDYVTLGKNNLAYVQTQLLLPKQEWKTSGRYGLGLKTDTRTLKPDSEENQELRLSAVLLNYQGLR